MQLLHQLCAASGLHGTCEVRVLQGLVKCWMTHGNKQASLCVFVCMQATYECVAFAGMDVTSMFLLFKALKLNCDYYCDFKYYSLYY